MISPKESFASCQRRWRAKTKTQKSCPFLIRISVSSRIFEGFKIICMERVQFPLSFDRIFTNTRYKKPAQHTHTGGRKYVLLRILQSWQESFTNPLTICVWPLKSDPFHYFWETNVIREESPYLVLKNNVFKIKWHNRKFCAPKRKTTQQSSAGCSKYVASWLKESPESR